MKVYTMFCMDSFEEIWRIVSGDKIELSAGENIVVVSMGSRGYEIDRHQEWFPSISEAMTHFVAKAFAKYDERVKALQKAVDEFTLNPDKVSHVQTP